MNEIRVGIVILTYNRADVVEQCLDSLVRAKNDTRFSICVIDNASRLAEFKKIKRAFDLLKKERVDFDDELIRMNHNTGFPGGNNIGIKKFLKEDDITHICLLNSDVILTDYWLDRLIAHDSDAIGPVTNACGNEQTIATDLQLDSCDNNFEKINKFAQKRYILFENFVKETNFLGFFCFIGTRELFLKVGYLDEIFGRGAFEDDDYCLRILNAGFKMHIARDVFLYHWGTASFSQIPVRKLMRHLQKNKTIFEYKHNITWKDRSLLPYLGFKQDMHFLLSHNDDKYAKNVFDNYYEIIVSTIDHLTNITQKCDSLFIKASLRFYNLLNRIWRFIHIRYKRISYIVLTRKILFLVHYPTEDDLKDGYFQRVNAIDKILSVYLKFYVRYYSGKISRNDFRMINKINANTFEISINKKNPIGFLALLIVHILSGRIYLHSILRLNSKLHRILFRTARKRILDVHGVVPEEFLFHGDKIGYKDFNEIEKFAIRRANVVIVVTNMMAKHLRCKYSFLKKSRILLLPIFPTSSSGSAKPTMKSIKDKEVIIYCGGLQKWQQVHKMLDFVHSLQKRYDFVFLVPQPDELKDIYTKKFRESFPGIVISAGPDDVKYWYNKADFGLVLREDVIVNRAACPTKLIEYLQHDIIPIVDTVQIGDFDELGYKYISYKRFLNSYSEDKINKKEWVKTNKRVLDKIAMQVIDGERLLAKKIR